MAALSLSRRKRLFVHQRISRASGSGCLAIPWRIWSLLPEGASVVQLELPGGATYWQRPVARTVFFSVSDPDTLAQAHATAYNSVGDPITAQEAAFLEGHENWRDALRATP